MGGNCYELMAFDVVAITKSHHLETPIKDLFNNESIRIQSWRGKVLTRPHHTLRIMTVGRHWEGSRGRNRVGFLLCYHPWCNEHGPMDVALCIHVNEQCYLDLFRKEGKTQCCRD